MVGHPVVNYRPTTPRPSTPTHDLACGKRNAPPSTEKSPFKPHPKRKRLSQVVEGQDAPSVAGSDESYVGSAELPELIVNSPVPHASEHSSSRAPAPEDSGSGSGSRARAPEGLAGRRFLKGKKQTISLVNRDGSILTQKDLNPSQYHVLKYPRHSELDDVYMWEGDGSFRRLSDDQVITVRVPTPLDLSTVGEPFFNFIIPSTKEAHHTLGINKGKGKPPQPAKAKPTVIRATLSAEEAQGTDPNRPVGILELISVQEPRDKTPKRALKLQGRVAQDSEEDNDSDEVEDLGQSKKKPVQTGKTISQLLLGPHDDLPASLKKGNNMQKHVAVMGLALRQSQINHQREFLAKMGDLTLSQDARKTLEVISVQESNNQKQLALQEKKLELLRPIVETGNVKLIRLALEKLS